MKHLGIIILLVFYSVYLGKMILQKKKGIQTDQMAKGKQKGKEFYIELVMKIATYSVVIIEILSIFFVKPQLPKALLVSGSVIGFMGDVIFAISVYTMKDSWRAGIAKNDRTELITNGIYQISRNPAFVGFDLVYVGLLLMYFNWILLIFTCFAMVMLHLQILQEENHLVKFFGVDYVNYQKKVFRYLGRKWKKS